MKDTCWNCGKPIEIDDRSLMEDYIEKRKSGELEYACGGILDMRTCPHCGEKIEIHWAKLPKFFVFRPENIDD